MKDLTGAGDVFAAAFFIRATDRTISAVRAGRFANAVAALSLSEVGPYGIPTLPEVEAFLKAQDAMPEKPRSLRSDVF